jgi:N utilization substance protein A
MEDTSIRRPELLHVADAVSRERGISRDEILGAMEVAIARAARARYGDTKDIRATIDRKGGAVQISRWVEIVDPAEFASPASPAAEGAPAPRAFDEDRHMPIGIALKIKPDARVGEFLVDPLPPIDFGRVAAQAAKQAIVQGVRDIERAHEYDAWKDRVGEIVSGTVKRIEYGNVVVELGRHEALMKRSETILRETHKVGDRVRAYVMDVCRDSRGPQIMVSRTHPNFLARLFAAEVPEIYEGIIEIKAVARDPGSRAKMAVISRDSSIDPIGACIGRMGSRVRPVSQELGEEKIDIIKWSPQPATFIVDALQPAEVSKVVIHEEEGRVEVIVPDEQLSLAIGRRGQNVRLASQLTHWKIDVMGAEAEHKRREDEASESIRVFVDGLDVDDMIARLLIAEGFTYVEQLFEVGVDEVAAIDGLEDIAEELVNRSEAYVNRKFQEAEERRVALGVTDDLAAFDAFTVTMLVSLGENGVKTLDDLADLAAYELVEFVGADNLDEETAGAVIMAARAHWFAEAEPAA